WRKRASAARPSSLSRRVSTPKPCASPMWKVTPSSPRRVLRRARSGKRASTVNFIFEICAGFSGSNPEGPTSTAHFRSPGKYSPAFSSTSLSASGVRPLTGWRKMEAMAGMRSGVLHRGQPFGLVSGDEAVEEFVNGAFEDFGQVVDGEALDAM